MPKIPELVCPAGNLPALKTAVDNGADTVYMGLKDAKRRRKEWLTLMRVAAMC